MRKLTRVQETILAEFFRELSVATIAGGGITALIDKSLLLLSALFQFGIFLIVGLVFLIISLSING
ncbi:MAG: hypothetical protein AAB437_03380 [Patescibacteria group bacterium]